MRNLELQKAYVKQLEAALRFYMAGGFAQGLIQNAEASLHVEQGRLNQMLTAAR